MNDETRHAAALLRGAANLLDPVDDFGNDVTRPPDALTAAAWRVADAAMLLRTALHANPPNRTVLGFNAPTGRGAILGGGFRPQGLYNVFHNGECVRHNVEADNAGLAAIGWMIANPDVPEREQAFALPTRPCMSAADLDPADALTFASVTHDDGMMDSFYTLLIDHLCMLVEEAVLTGEQADAHADACVEAFFHKVRAYVHAAPVWREAHVNAAGGEE